MSALQFPDGLSEFVIVHTHRALKFALDFLFGDLREWHALDVVFGHRGGAARVQLIKQLTYHSVKATTAPSVVAGMAVQDLKQRKFNVHMTSVWLAVAARRSG